MRFTYYTTKSPKQCAAALNERLRVLDGGKSKPPLYGEVTKEGEFSLALEGKVIFGLARRTQLQGKLERESGHTVIHGYVPQGVPPNRMRLVIGALIAVGAVILTQGLAALGLITALIGLGMYIPLVGDYRNSPVLLKELRRALDAKDKPPA